MKSCVSRCRMDARGQLTVNEISHSPLVVRPGSIRSVTVSQGYENRPADLLAVWRRPACMFRCPIGDVGGDTGHGTNVAEIHYRYDERSTGATGRHPVNAPRPCTHIRTASS